MFEEDKNEIIILKERCSLFQQQIDKLEQLLREKEIENRNFFADASIYKHELNKKSEFKKNLIKSQDAEQEKMEEWRKEFINNIDNYYTLKESLFYPNEQLVFYCLNNIFKNKTWGSQKYSIFPKVRIADYIEPLPNENHLHYRLYHHILKVLSMHTDFLICEIIPDGHNTKYKPVLVIEINGESHITRLDVKENDEFKSSLFKAFGIKQIFYEMIGTVCNLANLQSSLEEKIKNELPL